MLSITFPYSLNQKNDRKTTGKRQKNAQIVMYVSMRNRRENYHSVLRLYQVKEKKNCNPLFFLQGFLTHKLLERLENERATSQNLLA